MLENAGLRDGCFLVRISKRNPGQHVLTMSYDTTVYNYEIKNTIIGVSFIKQMLTIFLTLIDELTSSRISLHALYLSMLDDMLFCMFTERPYMFQM